MASFEGPRGKLRRAARHIDEFSLALDAWHQTDWSHVSLQKSATGEYAFNVQVRGQPQDLELIVGDAVHNLRAALDLLAVEAVVKAGGSPKDVYFPFSRDEASLDESIRRSNFHRAGPRAINAVRVLRPYANGNAALRALHDLDIKDKHRELIAASFGITSPEVRVVTDSTGKPVGFDEGQLQLEIIPGSRPEVVFVFPEEGPLSQQPILPTLRAAHAAVDRVVGEFSALFP